MSDVSQGPGWWQASDGKWYAPEQGAGYVPPPPPPTPAAAAPAPPVPPVTTPDAGPEATPPEKKSHRGLWIAIGAIVVVIIIIVASSSSKKNNDTTAATAAGSTPTTAATPATAAAPTTTTTAASPVPTVVWTQSGSGQSSGAQFTIPSNAKGWNEVWTYDCSAFGSSGNFITTVNGFGGAAGTTDQGVNELGANGSGTEHYYDTGTFSIDVNSECNWTDQAVVIPK